MHLRKIQLFCKHILMEGNVFQPEHLDTDVKFKRHLASLHSLVSHTWKDSQEGSATGCFSVYFLQYNIIVNQKEML